MAQARALPARALTYTLADCTRDYTYIAARRSGWATTGRASYRGGSALKILVPKCRGHGLRRPTLLGAVRLDGAA